MTDSRIENLLAEMINLYKIVNKDKISNILSEELDDEKKIQIYNLSDGVRTTRQIIAEVGGSTGTVSKYWKRWSKLGLVYESETKGRYVHSFNLENYDLDNKE